MDERDMEEKGTDKEREGWGIGMEKVIFGIVILCLVMFMCIQVSWNSVPSKWVITGRAL
jgi:hypothetical protein